MPGIKPAIADHFKVLFRDMPDQTFDEIHCGNGFLDVFIIFMTVVTGSTLVISYIGYKTQEVKASLELG